MPHRHAEGQHIVVTEGVGVVAGGNAVRVVGAGDAANLPGGWNWNNATLTTSTYRVTAKGPGLDLDVERRDWDGAYTDDLGK